MIKGLHVTMFTNKAEALRAFLRDTLGLQCTDSGGGWLIFEPPEAEIGVHPTGWEGQPDKAERGEPYHEMSLYCDDIDKTVATLKTRGVQFTSPVTENEWGFVTHLRMPGGFVVDLYQPKYEKKKGKKATKKRA